MNISGSAMYRVLCAVFICMSTVSGAPQDAGDFTYVNPPTAPNQGLEPTAKDSLEATYTTGKDSPDRRETDPQYANEVTTPYVDSKEFYDTPQSTVFQQYSSTAYETVNEATTPRAVTTSEVPQKEISPRVRSPSPRFVSKLGYFKNSDKSYTGVGQTNFIERAGKKKFKSRCRCEKITNCPKLQITVPRCPEEYFLCCF